MNRTGHIIRTVTELAIELAALEPARGDANTASDGVGAAGHVPRRGGVRELPIDYVRIATTGVYDPSRHPTPSHARQAVLTAAVWAGHDLASVLGRMHSDRWPRLTAFYTRYRTAAQPCSGTGKTPLPWSPQPRPSDQPRTVSANPTQASQVHTARYKPPEKTTETPTPNFSSCGPGNRR